MNQNERNALGEVVDKLTTLIKTTSDLDKVYEYITQLREIRTKLAAAETARPSAIKQNPADGFAARPLSERRKMAAAAASGEPDASPKVRANPARK